MSASVPGWFSDLAQPRRPRQQTASVHALRCPLCRSPVQAVLRLVAPLALQKIISPCDCVLSSDQFDHIEKQAITIYREDPSDA